MFKAFKGFGKPKEKPGGAPARRIAILEETTNGNGRSLEELAQKIEGLVKGSNGEEGPKPHGPLGELSIVPAESNGEETTDVVPEVEAPSPEQVKLVEVNLAKGSAAAPPAAAAPPVAAVPPAAAVPAPSPAPTPAPVTAPVAEAKPGAAPSVEGLNNLFRAEEEEENPLANLIRTLPEYTTHEIVEDLNEIKSIMREWHKG